MLDASPDAVMVIDDTGRIGLANARTAELFGRDRADLIGSALDALVPGLDLSSSPVEVVVRRRDGTEFPAEVRVTSFDADDGPLVSVSVRDIADRRLAAIVRSSHDAIIGKDLAGNITSWNPGAAHLFGHAEEEVVGRPIDVIVPPDQRAEERAIMERIARGERVEQIAVRRVAKDGTPLVVSLTVSPIDDGAGNIVGAASVCRDVGERLQAEAYFRAVLEAAPDAMVCVDAGGVIALVNAQAERLFGYRREEMVDHSIEMLVPERVRPVHHRWRAGYLADPHPRPMGAGMDLSGRRKDGSEFPAEISLSAIETDDGFLVSAAVRDVTDRLEAEAERERLRAEAERERLESRLQQSQRMESLGQLAGGVAHDFNNLLSVIVNYTTFASETVSTAAEHDPDQWQSVEHDLSQVRRAADRAAELTRQLLAFGRREVVRPRLLDLNAVVDDVEQLLRRTLGEDVELVTSLSPDLLSVLADPGQIEQVLVNLAVNARDAMPGGGRLTIDTDNVLVDADYVDSTDSATDLAPGSYVRLRVSDTGAGMDPEVVAHAFEPFFTTKPKGEGTGLGLATVYGIVNQASGRVSIYSEPGMGTTFVALFPAVNEAAAPVEIRGEARAAGGGETVLVVEDEDALREVTRRILARNGYEVLTAARGSEAVAAATGYGGPIDLLLTDVVMPEMLGQEVANRVREVRPGIRVLYMSGYAQPVLASKGTLDEGVVLIEKPFSEPGLLAKVREVLDE